MKKTLKIAAITALALLSTTAAHAQWAPERPVEFVVASGAGGGTDNFTRTIQAIITKHGLMDQPIVVLNKGAGSGAEAFLYAKQNASDPYKLIFGTNNVYLLPHVAKMAYTTADLTPIAALAVDEFLIWVKADSPYKTASDLIDAAKADPGKIVFGGSQSKDTDETLVALIEQKTGADFKYVPFNGGGEVNVQLAGGHVAANVNNPNENIGQWQAGAIRPLCVFAPERMAGTEKVAGDMSWHDIPTCSESGIDISAYEMPRTVWAPAGIPDDALKFYTDMLQKVAESPEWQDYITKTSQSGKFLAGKDFQGFIDQTEGDALSVFKAEGWLVQ
jgi:tripartite-type tricarboxylate transporter receptor subunit TctC